jgi:hypothetical protein
MSWHEHHLAHSTYRNTARAADASEDMLDGRRRAELERHGLIDFNAPAGVVRAVERRLAIERGEPVRRMFDIDVVTQMVWWGLGATLLGLVLVAALSQIGAASVIGGLMLIGGLVSTTFGLAERRVSLQLHGDAEQLASYEATRGRRSLES